jgi:dihydrofolate synthase/folylpolyglutamate synthase
MHHQFPITARSIADGVQQTRWPARLERIQTGDTQWILDVAHNPAGAWALRAGLNAALTGELAGARLPRILIFSCLRDKPVAEMAQILFPLFDLVLIPPIKTARAADTRDIVAAAEATGTLARASESVGQAMKEAGNQASGGQVVVSGSVYLVGEARSLLLQLVEDHR